MNYMSNIMLVCAYMLMRGHKIYIHCFFLFIFLFLLLFLGKLFVLIFAHLFLGENYNFNHLEQFISMSPLSSFYA
jgi:hypothetical protein